jgi:outer membrane receptor protein involved in Fe transport
MKKPNLLSTSALGSALILVVSAAAAPAMAAPLDAPAPVTVLTADDLAAADAGENVTITGSRIPRPDFSQPNPITSVDSASIEQSGQSNLLEYLQGIPALVGSPDAGLTAGSAGFIGSTGLNLLNLRNLGVERTLVLVNGRRHVASLPETAAIDIATIPVELIERIDVVTGGTGAVYGADAVSGVVNFILKTDYEGVSAYGEIGMPSAGGFTDWRVGITAGHNFAAGRGNIAGSVEVSHEGRLEARERSYLRPGRYATMQRNINDDPDDPNVPDEIPVIDAAFFDSSREGGIDIDFDGVPDLRPNGQPYEIGTFIPPFYSVGGTGTLRSDYIGDIRSKDRRYNFNLFLNYEFSDALKFFAEGKYVRGNSFSASQPTFDYYILIPTDNPFIPAAVASQLSPDGLLLNRDNFDLGIRGDKIRRDLFRGVMGFKGDLSDTIKYELSYTYGQSKVRNTQLNNRFNDRYLAALDAVDDGNGNIVCRSNIDPTALLSSPNYNYDTNNDGVINGADNLSFTPGPNSGCVPLNLFGEGVASQAAIDWVMTDSIARSKMQQHVLSGFVSGSIPGLTLPGGDIGFVVGGEYRKELSKSDPAIEDQLGQTFGNVIFPTDGDFDVKEAFAEIRLPLLRDKPFAEVLEFNAAARVSDYSTVGTTWTWNVNGIWAPVRDISFRGTYARAVRAPNIGELFSPNSQTFEFIDDPCDINQLNNGASTREANCAALLTSLGVDPTTFLDPNSTNIPGIQRGNPFLSEETAKSWTAGLILKPRFIPGLNIALDWYDIKIANAISTAAPEEVAENCVDSADLNNVFCDAITRQPGTGRIVDFLIQPENVAAFRTAGLDFNVAYRMELADLGLGDNAGRLDIRAFGNYLDKLTFIPAPNADLDDDRGEQYAPKWQLTLDLTWKKDAFTVNYGFNFFSKTLRYSNADIAGDPDLASKENLYYDARHTHDLYVGYDFNDKYRVYAGVNNIFNQKPDLATYYPVSPLGTFFYAGVKVGMPDIFK